MKKTLAMLLAMLMVMSCMVFTTAAEEATTEPAEEQIRFVPMSDCDSTESWSVSNQHIHDMVLTLDEQEFTQGTGSVSFSFTGVQTITGALNWLWQNTKMPLDITGMAALRFDFYTNNAAAVVNAHYDVEIRDVDHLYAVDTDGDGKVDTEFEAGGQLRLLDYIVGDAQDGWNTVEIPLEDLANWHNVDMTRVAYFRMFQTSPGRSVIKVDDVATGEVKYGTPQNIVGFEGETTIKLDNVYFASAVQGGEQSGNYHWLTKGSNPVYFSGATAEVSRGKVAEVDARVYDTVVFDLYVEDLSLGKANLCVELCSGGACDYEESAVTKTLDDYAALTGKTLAVGWNTIEVPFSALKNNGTFYLGATGNAAGGSCDYRTLDYFRLYFTKGSFTIDDDGDGVTGNDINTEAGETEPEREFNHYVATANVRLATRNTDTAVLVWDATAAPVGGSANMGDVDGDGIKEWVWKNDAGKGEITYAANTGAMSISFGTTASGYANMVGLEMEIYVSDAAATNKGTMYMEISHANTCDGTPERSVSGTLNGIFGTTIKPGEWQTVRVYHTIPDRLESNLLTYVNATTERDKTGTFNPAGFNYIRIYGDNFTATDLKVAMRNFKVLRNFNYEQPTEEGCTAPLTMDADSPMSMASRMRLPTEQDPFNNALPIVNKKYGETFGFGTQSQITFAEGQTLDLTGMDTMHFDLYLENFDPAIKYEFEIRSAGGDDTKERRFTQATWAQIVGHNNLKDGWNHVEIPLEAFSAASATDMSAINYLRIFSQNSAEQTITVDKTTIVAIDNLCFSGTRSDSVDTMNFNTYRWDANVSSKVVNIPKGDDAANMAWQVVASDGTTTTGLNARSARKTFIYKASETSLLSMDIYLEDYENTKSNGYQFEVSSSGAMDTEEMQRSGTMEEMFGNYVINADGSKGTLGEGWNHVEIPLADFKNAASCNKSNISWVGIYPNSTPATTGNAYRVAFDNIQFIEPAAGPTKITSAQPTLTESIDFTIKAQNPAGDPVAIECIFAGDASTVGTKTAVVKSEDGYFYTTFDGIPAHRMTDTLTIKLWTLDKDGRLAIKDTVKNYSVQQYAVNTLKNNASNTKLVTLLSDLLTYGAATQVYANNYNADALATDVGEGVTLTPTTTFTVPEKLTTVVSGTPLDDEFDATFKVATLVLDGTAKIRFGFAANTAEGLTVNVNGTPYTEFTTGTDSRGNELYYVDIPVLASQFSDTFTASFNANAGYVVNYSVNHYIATKYDETQIKTAALLKALYNYGASAVNYIAK